ncbi:hypothetical protein C900_05348 [Fulvivirga imtechensis AK7]|uniref:Uncharacterized protein n=1 Tax=Fulvivirga imtechensis AK7 TaxID=1237149 RepID=L8JPJ2_9BACT|nr:hypothetical protein C900_05348 [Fulvivirga imtechensis AK7]
MVVGEKTNNRRTIGNMRCLLLTHIWLNIKKTKPKADSITNL